MKIKSKASIFAILFGIGLGIAGTTNAARPDCSKLYERCSNIDRETGNASSCWSFYESYCQ